MDHNPVKTLPPRAFHLTGLINVQKVFLKNCSLNDLDPTALAGLVILIELDLSENKIKELKQGTFQVSYTGIYTIEMNKNIRTVRSESSGVKLTRFKIEGWLELIRTPSVNIASIRLCLAMLFIISIHEIFKLRQ